MQDVEEVFGTSNAKIAASRPTGLPNAAAGTGAKSRGIRLAIDTLWPSGIPHGLTGKDRNRKIEEWLRANGHSVPTDLARAVQRALKS